MKKLALIFCGEDSNSARTVANSIKNDEWGAQVVSAYEFNHREADADRVIIMRDVPGWHADRIAAAYPHCESTKTKPEEKPEMIDAVLPKRRGRKPKTG